MTPRPNHEPGAASRVHTLLDVLVGLERWPDAPAVISFRGGVREDLSYGDLDRLSRRLAAGLRERGLAPGEAVAICAENRPETVIARFAVIAAGGLLVSIDPDSTGEQIGHILSDCGCRRAFVLRETLPLLRDAGGPELETVLLESSELAEAGTLFWRDVLAEVPAEAPSGARRAEARETATLFYTSGTTGAPKGVPLSHANIAHNLNALLALGLLGPNDRVLLPLPLYHSYPFIVGMLTPLAAGAAMVLPAEVTGPALQTALREGRPTLMIGVPRLYHALYSGIEGRAAARGRLPAAVFRALLALSMRAPRALGYALRRRLFAAVHAGMAPSLRVLACGGARLDPDLERRLEGFGWQVLTGYGLVETASISTFNPPGRARVGSAGLPVSGVEVRIEAHDAEGRGEVLIRGPNVFEGYLNNPEANRAAFTPEGWFRSGDLGTRDAAGYLYIHGRVKEMIVLPDGKNVSPEDVEAVYRESPYLREIAVIEHGDGLAGLAVPEVEALREAGSARVQDLIRMSIAELSQRLPPYQRLSDFAITREDLPRTRLGKYQRHRLPEIYARAQRRERAPEAPVSEADQALLESPQAAALWDWLRRRFPDHTLSPDTSPQLDLGIDSLAWVNIGLEIEQDLGLHLSEDTLARTMTLRDLLRHARDAPERRSGAADSRETRRRRLLAEQQRWLAPTGPWLALLGRLVYAAVWLIARLVFRLRVAGKKNVPETGPLIIAPNHASDLDPFLLAAALSHAELRATYWGADLERLFTNPVGRLLARAARIFPVDDRAPGASLEAGIAVLERGANLIWFPEEWRSPDGRLQEFLPGVAHLAVGSGATVVPVYIDGSFQAMPRYRRLPRPHRVTVTFGPPLSVDELAERGRGKSREERICGALRDAVAALARE